MTRRPLNDKGVSVIIGTLLLILITVTAAAALALMISQMQKAEATRQSQIQNVHDEDIVISGMKLMNDPNVWNTPQNGNITNSQNWSSISFNLMNLNTQDARLNGIAINNQYGLNFDFTSLSGSYDEGNCDSLGEPDGFCNTSFSNPNLNSNLSYFTIPAGQSTKITIDLTSAPVPVGTGNQVDIKVLTLLTNLFEQTYKLPTPVIVYNTGTTTLGTVQRDNIVLDGSQSSSENATIVSWNWTLMNATQTYTNGAIDPLGNCSDVNDLSTISVPPYFSSKIAHFSPPISGPFCVNLTVTDSNGMIATSPYQVIPADQDFVPPTSINPSLQGHLLNVTVDNINNIPVSGQSVSYSITQYSDGYPFTLTLQNATNSISQTDQWGNVQYKVCGNGTVAFSSGPLSPRSITFTNNTCS
jgi:flagellin-like protein